MLTKFIVIFVSMLIIFMLPDDIAKEISNAA